MPTRGDLMYSAFAGKLRVVRFVREEIAPGASLPTYIMQEGEFPNRREFRCPTDMYVETEREAWEIYLKECESYLPNLVNGIQEAKDRLQRCKSEIQRASKRIRKLTPVK